MQTKPCYNCPDRHPHCHSTCGEYKDFKDDIEAKNAYLRKDQEYQIYRGREDIKITKYMKRKGIKR